MSLTTMTDKFDRSRQGLNQILIESPRDGDGLKGSVDGDNAVKLAILTLREELLTGRRIWRQDIGNLS